ncbi:hypothetical protein [Micromonospora sp. 15K316]|uniref:hypothetical protein n=1 Tax=Micromonospora sp. 15K316 TaxID=2530376 RepID=UPI0014049CB3|nr:hypothetical protein [Micromonospora sp. 15K316]
MSPAQPIRRSRLAGDLVARQRGGAPAAQQSPDGRLAAFAQTDEVIVVDLTTAQVRRYPLNGYLEHVLRAGDRRGDRGGPRGVRRDLRRPPLSCRCHVDGPR